MKHESVSGNLHTTQGHTTPMGANLLLVGMTTLIRKHTHSFLIEYGFDIITLNNINNRKCQHILFFKK